MSRRGTRQLEEWTKGRAEEEATRQIRRIFFIVSHAFCMSNVRWSTMISLLVQTPSGYRNGKMRPAEAFRGTRFNPAEGSIWTAVCHADDLQSLISIP